MVTKKLIILVLLTLMNANFVCSQEKKIFTFNPVITWEAKEKANTYIVSGKYSMDIKNINAWIFLQDTYQNVFLQFPPLEFIDDSTWEASNISIGNGIRYLLAIQVDATGHQQLLQMVKEEHWSGINYETIKALPGYERLSIFKLDMNELNKLAPVAEKPQSKKPEPPQPPKPEPKKNKCLLIIDFEDITNKWRIQTWSHPGKFKVKSGYKKLNTSTKQNGSYCVFIELPMDSTTKDGGWCGGGLVINLQENNRAIDLTRYRFLQFDICMTDNSDLANIAVKLEGAAKQSYPERKISEYGVQISTEWQTVKIPLEHFSRLLLNDRKDMNPINLSSVTKLVTVSILDSKYKSTKGTLFLDNIMFAD